MTEFKEGDEVWWFEGPDQCLLIWLGNLELRHSIYTDEDENYLYTEDCGLFKDKKAAYFKSRSEAIDAMIEHLQTLGD